MANDVKLINYENYTLDVWVDGVPVGTINRTIAAHPSKDGAWMCHIQGDMLEVIGGSTEPHVHAVRNCDEIKPYKKEI